MGKKMNTFGISLIMSQVDPYYSEIKEDWGDYTLFGPFDGLRIEVIDDNVDEFITSPQTKLANYTRAGERMQFQSKVQKQFLYMDDEDGTRRSRLKLYSECIRRSGKCGRAETDATKPCKNGQPCDNNDKGKPFIALFAVKLHPQFVEYERCDNGLNKCVENTFKNYMTRKKHIPSGRIECFVMNSLSADDRYILVGMDKPWYGEVMGFVRYLNDWSCKCKCTLSSEYKISGKTQALEVLKKLKLRIDNNYQIPDEDWMVEINGNDINIIDWLINSHDQKVFLAKQEIDNACDKLLKKFNEAIEDSKYKKSKLLLDCINTIRIFGPVPVVFTTYTILGYEKELFRDENDFVNAEKLFDATADPLKTNNEGYEMFTWHYRIALRAGASGKFSEYFVGMFNKGSKEVNASKKAYNDYIANKLSSKTTEKQAFPNDFVIEGICTELPMTIGRYDYTWQSGQLSPVQLLYICTQILRKGRIKADNASPLLWIRESYSRLSLDGLSRLSPAERIKKKSEIENLHVHVDEDMVLSRLWAEKQENAMAILFVFVDLYDRENNVLFSNEKLGELLLKIPGDKREQNELRKLIEDVKSSEKLKGIIKSINKDIRLKQTFDVLSALHIQGCQSFFHMASWREFDDVRKFFVAFYKQISDIFLKDLPSEDYKGFDDVIYNDVRESMNIGIKCLSALFHDRLIADMSLRENTRPGLYAAGAYERLIGGYSRCLENLTKLLAYTEAQCDIKVKEALSNANVRDMMRFTLMPVEDDGTHSHSLFPSRYDGIGRLIIYEMPLQDMLGNKLGFESVVPVLAHEVGHYWGILDRDKRTRVWIEMVSYLTAHHISKTLRMRSYYSLPVSALAFATKELEESFKAYFSNETANISKYLHFIVDHCKIALNKFISKPPESHLTENASEYGLITALAKLYHEAGALSMLEQKGRFFDRLLADSFALASEVTLFIIRECYADMIAICTLNMTQDEAVKWLCRLFETGDETNHLYDGYEKMVYRYEIHALRVVSALFLTSDVAKNAAMKALDPNKNQDERKQEIDDAIIETQIQMRDKEDVWKNNEHLSELMFNIAEAFCTDKATSLYPFVSAWLQSSKYLFNSYVELRKYFPHEGESSLFKSDYESNNDEKLKLLRELGKTLKGDSLKMEKIKTLVEYK